MYVSANEYSADKYRNNLVEVQQVLKKKKAWLNWGWEGCIREGFPKEVTTELGSKTEVGSH